MIFPERPEIPSCCTDCTMELLPSCAETHVRLPRTHPVVVPKGTIPSNTCCETICVPPCWLAAASMTAPLAWSMSGQNGQHLCVQPVQNRDPIHLGVAVEMKNAAQSSQPTNTTGWKRETKSDTNREEVGWLREHRAPQDEGNWWSQHRGSDRTPTEGNKRVHDCNNCHHRAHGQSMANLMRHTPDQGPHRRGLSRGLQRTNPHEEINRLMKGTIMSSTERDRPKLKYGCQTFASPATIMGNRTSTCTRLAIATNSSQNCTRSASAIPA